MCEPDCAPESVSVESSRFYEFASIPNAPDSMVTTTVEAAESPIHMSPQTEQQQEVVDLRDHGSVEQSINSSSKPGK